MTEAEATAAARKDPDAQPITPVGLKKMRRVPRVKVVRQALGMSQEEFAAAYEIPLGTLRDWEQGRAQPDKAALAYLKVIAGDPYHIQDLLQPVER
jgi:putative transcriptional regulator